MDTEPYEAEEEVMDRHHFHNWQIVTSLVCVDWNLTNLPPQEKTTLEMKRTLICKICKRIKQV